MLPHNEIDLHYYLVAFLDILGQGEKLERLKHFPRDEDERRDFGSLLLQTHGHVRALREWFREGLEPPSDKELTLLGVAEGRKPIVSLFSDCVVISVSLLEDGYGARSAALFGVNDTLRAVGRASLAALTAGIPVRGGVAVGMAATLPPDGVYGYPLHAAVALEKKASYPRVLIHESVQHYLDRAIEEAQSVRNSHEAALAVYSKSFIRTDPEDSSILMLDPRAAEFRHRLMPNALDAAIAWVEREERRFAAEGRSDLQHRYSRLRAVLCPHEDNIRSVQPNQSGNAEAV